jgi:hypothetical protein
MLWRGEIICREANWRLGGLAKRAGRPATAEGALQRVSSWDDGKKQQTHSDQDTGDGIDFSR